VSEVGKVEVPVSVSFCTVTWRCVSQPVAVQNGVAPLQAWPQTVQLLVVPSGAVQPFSGFVARHQPDAQVGLQVLLVHARVVTLVAPHLMPQPPQLSGFELLFVSQPFEGVLSQSA
jgi:hypothetical protein